MGKYLGWRPEYDKHPLAASMDNYTVMIDIELKETCPNPDLEYSLKAINTTNWLFIFCCFHDMAKKINNYCDTHKISEDMAAEYWLERFLWVTGRICDFSRLK